MKNFLLPTLKVYPTLYIVELQPKMGSCCTVSTAQEEPLEPDVTCMFEERCVWELTVQHETSLQLSIQSQLQSSFPSDIIAMVKSYLVNIIDIRSTNSNLKYIRKCYSYFKNNGLTTGIYKIDVVFMSDEFEGKTKLLERWQFNKYEIVYNPLSIEFFRKQVENIAINVEDITAIDEYQSIRDSYMRDSKFFVYCFSVHSLYSPLDRFAKWYATVIEMKDLSKKIATNINIDVYENPSSVMELGNHFCVSLCALQCDLCGAGDDGENENNKRIITYQQGLEIAKRYNIPYIETSAILNENVDQLFEIIVREYTCFQYRRSKCK